MRLYAVFEKGESKKPPRHPDDNVELVKEGFSWTALLFGPLWALAHRMWVVFALLLALNVAISSMPRFFDGVTDDTVWFLHLVLMLVLGFLGNDLRQWSLARSGYDFVGMVSGTGITDAERRLFAAMGGPRYR